MRSFLARLREQRVWSDPLRKQRTLLSFSRTEEDGGRDLARAAQRVNQPELRAHLVRHSLDEQRHASEFRRRAAELAAEQSLPVGDDAATARPYDLASARPGLDVDAHGFFNAGLIDELGELEYVAMLHVAEKKAAELFATYRDVNAADPTTRALFDEILKDEKYHVAYTGAFLDKWRKAGRGAEVERALAAATSSRALGAWKRLGMRSATSFSRLVLHVLYWTVIAPFGLLARARAARGLASAAQRRARPVLRCASWVCPPSTATRRPRCASTAGSSPRRRKSVSRAVASTAACRGAPHVSASRPPG